MQPTPPPAPRTPAGDGPTNPKAAVTTRTHAPATAADPHTSSSLSSGDLALPALMALCTEPAPSSGGTPPGDGAFVTDDV